MTKYTLALVMGGSLFGVCIGWGHHREVRYIADRLKQMLTRERR